MKKILIEILRWSLRFHGIFHIGHIYLDIVQGQWLGVVMSSYMVVIELLASFLIPSDHVHFKPFQSEVHEDCCNDDHKD